MALLSILKSIIKQFPVIYPKGYIRSIVKHIDKKNLEAYHYNSNRGLRYFEIEKGETNFLPFAKSVQDGFSKHFVNHQAYKSLDKYLFFLPDSYVVGNEGLTINNRNYVFDELSHNFNISSLRKSKKTKALALFRLNPKVVKGVSASLLSPQTHNIYHWIFDVLIRTRLYEPVLDQIDWFLISSEIPANYISMLKYFGVPEEKLLKVGPDEKLHLEYLYAGSLPGSEGRNSRHDLQYLVKKLSTNLISSNTCPDKIYLSRGNATNRKIVNEAEIITLLSSLGFSIIDTGSLSLEEQINIMQNVKIICGYHGAAFFNTLFVPQNCKVIELFSPDYFRTDCFYNIAGLRNLDYWYIVGSKPPGTAWGDAYLGTELIEKTLTAINIE